MNPQRTCITCGQPIHGPSYLVTWTLNQSGPPTNIYAHPGPCAQQANHLYCTPQTLGPSTSTWSNSGSPNPPIPPSAPPSPHQLPLLPP